MVSERRSQQPSRLLWEVVRWELRLAYGRKSAGRTAGVWVTAAATAIAMAIVWAFATERQEWYEDRNTLAAEIHRFAVLGAISTPFRDPVFDPGQATAGYVALRISLYLICGVMRLALPAVAAGSIGKDRYSGRLEDLRTTMLPASLVYLGKAIAVSAPFVTWAAWVMLPFSAIALAFGTAVTDVFRLWVEMLGAAACVAGVSLYCSAAARSAWVARINAYLLLWVGAPLVWYAILFLLGSLDTPYLITGGYETELLPKAAFSTVCWVQALCVWSAFLLAWEIVRITLYGDPFWRIARATLFQRRR